MEIITVPVVLKRSSCIKYAKLVPQESFGGIFIKDKPKNLMEVQIYWGKEDNIKYASSVLIDWSHGLWGILLPRLKKDENFWISCFCRSVSIKNIEICCLSEGEIGLLNIG